MLESYVRAAAQRGAERCAASVPREMAATGATGASAGACVKERACECSSHGVSSSSSSSEPPNGGTQTND